MMHATLIRKWLELLPDDAEIGVTDGGLALATEDGQNYLEIGGLPEDSEGARL